MISGKRLISCLNFIVCNMVLYNENAYVFTYVNIYCLSSIWYMSIQYRAAIILVVCTISSIQIRYKNRHFWRLLFDPSSRECGYRCQSQDWLGERVEVMPSFSGYPMTDHCTDIVLTLPSNLGQLAELLRDLVDTLLGTILQLNFFYPPFCLFSSLVRSKKS